MQSHNIIGRTITNEPSNWITIKEAVEKINRQIKTPITDSDIYRNILYGNIKTSIYFQSPFKVRKIKLSKNKIKIKPIDKSLINRLCYLDRNAFLLNKNLIISTEDNILSLHPHHDVIDVPLIGHEYIEIKKLLAKALNIPLPKIERRQVNYGISTIYNENVYQVFECMTWNERIKKQIERLPANIISTSERKLLFANNNTISETEYFPIYHLPADACFVLRQSEINKLICFNNKCTSPHQPRVSTPLSRLFWLACQHNDTISPLIQHPYKLLSIFEQWALMDGITDRLSGDTLKTALQKGCPHYSSS